MSVCNTIATKKALKYLFMLFLIELIGKCLCQEVEERPAEGVMEAIAKELLSAYETGQITPAAMQARFLELDNIEKSWLDEGVKP